MTVDAFSTHDPLCLPRVYYIQMYYNSRFYCAFHCRQLHQSVQYYKSSRLLFSGLHITCVHMFSECYIFAFCVDYPCSNGCHYVLAVGSVGHLLFCASGTYDSHDTLPVTTWKSFCCAKVRPVSFCIQLICVQSVLVHNFV